MKIVIVDPSPLARNVYRLLVQQLAPELRVVELDTMEGLGAFDEMEALRGVIIGSAALEGAAQRYRALLTDVADWATLPKLVVQRHGTNGIRQAWDGLPNTQILQRPFSPHDFGKALSHMT